MAVMFELLKELTTSRTPKKVLVREEARHPITKHVNSISLENGGKKECKIECEAYHSLPVEPMRKAMIKKMITKKEDIGGNFVIPCNVGGLKYMDALVDQGSDVNVMPLSTYNRLTGEKLVETDIRLSLASQSHIQPLRIAADVLVEIAGFIYPMDFVILDIKEDRRNLFILGTPLLTTAKAEIRLDKGTITLKFGKSKTNFGKHLEFLCKFEKREKDKFDPVTPTSTINKLILEWEERIKLHQEKEKEFNQWRRKVFNDECSVLVSEGQKVSNEGGVT
ncbi:putative reverse transcriptase domain-containing protein [Tanacetum coccineum]